MLKDIGKTTDNGGCDMASMNTQNNLVFGLDIGTRNVVGTVGYLEHNRFKIVAMAMKEHETRAMLDGQIHDIYKVGDTIRAVKFQLEKQLGTELTEVCIAAAGRVLKTVTVHADYEFEQETRITQEHIYSLDLLGVEKAHEIINDGTSDVKFYCVGNTPVKYYLNGYGINSLEGHKADKIGVDLIATFLPEEVVDGLYEAVSYANLAVANLTLEPIAAINVAIPEQYRLLNIALIDVGAGTSDICITRSGSIAAYGMIPFAGDEITEVIAQRYLVDFNTAEKIKMGASRKKGFVSYKDIMGLAQKAPVEDIRNTVEEIVNKITRETAQKILELNGDKPVSAVFVVGGGGKIPSYTEKLSKELGILKERVALRGEEVLTQVDFNVEGFEKDSLFVTPVGICMNYYAQKNSFIFVQVNGQRIKLYDNNRLTVIDALMQAGFPNELLFPRRGRELEYTVNGKARLARGTVGEAAVITVNGKETNMNSAIEKNDKIQVKESTVGEPAVITIGQLEEFKSIVRFEVNGKTVSCPKFAYVNGELQSEYYEIQNQDQILMENYYTVRQLFEFLDIDITGMDVYVNNELAEPDTKVYENFKVKTREFTVRDEENEDQEEIIAEEKTDEERTEEKMESDIKDDIPQENRNLHVTVNQTPVTLSGKPEYVLVDVFLFYEFDLSTPKGKAIVIRCNGENIEYMSPIHEGDYIEVYWEQ